MMETVAGWMLVIAICGPVPDDCKDNPVDYYVWHTKADCERFSGKASKDPDAVCINVEVPAGVFTAPEEGQP